MIHGDLLELRKTPGKTFEKDGERRNVKEVRDLSIGIRVVECYVLVDGQWVNGDEFRAWLDGANEVESR